jgi:hypothetical protein
MDTITLTCECGTTTATIEYIETEAQYQDGIKTSSKVSQVALCDGCGIATVY